MELWRQDLAWKFHLALKRPDRPKRVTTLLHHLHVRPSLLLAARRRVHSDSELRLSDHEEQ